MKAMKMNWSESRTLNVGNYNSVRVEFGLEVELDAREDLDAAQQKLKQVVRDIIETECGELLAAKKAAH